MNDFSSSISTPPVALSSWQLAAAFRLGVEVAQSLGDERQTRRLSALVSAGNCPQGLFVEVAALDLLAYWKESEVYCRLVEDTDLDEQTASVWTRFEQDPTEFESIGSTKLAKCLMTIWMKHFSAKAPFEFGCDVLIGKIDEDLLVEAVAELLLQSRDSISKQ